MSDKKIIIHPYKSDGTLDETTALYPRTTADNVLGLPEGDTNIEFTGDSNDNLTKVTVGEDEYNVGTYSKPSGGIPKSDLASGVQSSLDKADSALQEHQSLANYSTTTQMNTALAAQKVTANPSGTGTTNLTKVKIDNVIYNVPSGGGGGQQTGSGTYNINQILMYSGSGFDIHSEYNGTFRDWLYGGYVNSMTMVASIDYVDHTFTFELDDYQEYAVMRDNNGDGYAPQGAQAYNINSTLSCSNFKVKTLTVSANDETIAYGPEFMELLRTFLLPKSSGGSSYLTPLTGGQTYYTTELGDGLYIVTGGTVTLYGNPYADPLEIPEHYLVYASEDDGGHTVSVTIHNVFYQYKQTYGSYGEWVSSDLLCAAYDGEVIGPEPPPGEPTTMKEAYESGYSFEGAVLIDNPQYNFGGYNFEIFFEDGSSMTGSCGGGTDLHYNGQDMYEGQYPYRVPMSCGRIVDAAIESQSGKAEELFEDLTIPIEILHE